MKRIFLMLAVSAILVAALAAPAFAVGKTNSQSCGLGDAVSADAQLVGGFGHYEAYAGGYNPGAENVGQHLQVYRELSQDGCQGNP